MISCTIIPLLTPSCLLACAHPPTTVSLPPAGKVWCPSVPVGVLFTNPPESGSKTCSPPPPGLDEHESDWVRSRCSTGHKARLTLLLKL